jgi:hypothetical protein
MRSRALRLRISILVLLPCYVAVSAHVKPRGKIVRVAWVFFCFVLVCLASLPAHGIKVVALGTTVEACKYAVEPTFTLVRQLGYPPDWNVAIACTEIAWKQLKERIDARSHYAFTLLKQRITFVRGEIFKRPPEWDFVPEEVFKHELGHIRCNCADERKAWKWAGSH